ncbi:MAG: hypothetical protein ACRDA5_11855 [Clostridium sp.]
MIDFLYRTMPFVLSVTLCQFIYIQIDQKYEVTKKISLKLDIKQEWKPFFCLLLSFICIILIGVLSIYMYIPEILCSILNGLILGIGMGISSKISPVNKIK